MKNRAHKIVYFSDLEFPSNTVATKQILKTVEALDRKGADVRLYLPVPWTGLRWNDASRSQRIREYYGITRDISLEPYFTWLPMTGRLHRPFVSRWMIRRIAKTYPDVLLVRNALHLKLGLDAGMPVVYETYKYQGRETGKVLDLLKRGSSLIGIIVHSELARRGWVDKGADPDRVLTVHNGADVSEIPSVRMNKDAARRSVGLQPDKKIILYTGNIDRAKGIESILALAAELPEYHFMIIGARAMKDVRRLDSFAHRLSVDNYQIIPWLPPTQIYPYLFAADVLIIPPTRKPLLEGGRTVLPIKTFMYLATGVPVVAPKLEDTAEILHHGGNAWLVTPDHAQQQAKEMRTLFDQPEIMNRISHGALETAPRYTWDARAGKILEFLDRRFAEKGTT